MSAKEEYIDRFDAYQSDKLSPAEREAFEQQLVDDEAFKADFDSYLTEVAVIKSLAIREEMGEVMSEARDSGKGRLRYLIPIGVAAVLTIFLLALPKKATKPEDLFHQYFEPYPNAISGREVVGGIDNALNSYVAGDYENAITTFDQLATTDTVSFYKSISHLALGEAKPALAGFQQIGSGSLFYESTQWYMALGFLLTGEPDSTRVYLNRISNKGVNFEAAQNILEVISNSATSK